ncbi:25888_t:CDS:2 [Gigaspora margarita]|uniref:25888_t:CDS:1 n=1 Tax=Gigaspora margarita TaxID=4874 RepID=A0ABN7VS12_GIGMA|nr:25888_t:CDS:2 [Gigaspora margarita]
MNISSQLEFHIHQKNQLIDNIANVIVENHSSAVMEDYGIIEDDFDNYYPDDNPEIAEGSGTSTETFTSNSLATTKPSIQTTFNISTISSESKKKGNKIL